MVGRVLIVDDSTFMRMLLKNILARSNFEVVGEADNGVRAVEEYKTVDPDLVTLDITMPEMNGFEALKAIMAFDPAARVIMCSVMGQQSMVMEAIKAGAVDFIVKPFDKTRVVEALTKAMGQ